MMGAVYKTNVDRSLFLFVVREAFVMYIGKRLITGLL